MKFIVRAGEAVLGMRGGSYIWTVRQDKAYGFPSESAAEDAIRFMKEIGRAREGAGITGRMSMIRLPPTERRVVLRAFLKSGRNCDDVVTRLLLRAWLRFSPEKRAEAIRKQRAKG